MNTLSNTLQSELFRYHRSLGKRQGLLFGKAKLVNARYFERLRELELESKKYKTAKAQQRSYKKLVDSCSEIKALQMQRQLYKRSIRSINLQWYKCMQRLHRFWNASDLAKENLEAMHRYAKTTADNFIAKSLSNGDAFHTERWV